MPTNFKGENFLETVLMSKLRLIYTSEAELDLRLSDVKEILETARCNNQALGVCGMLYYNSKYFLQALEGDKEKVMQLYDKISEDFRHDGVHIVSKDAIDIEQFSNWTMGYAGNSKAVGETLTSLNIDSDDLTALNAEQALQLLVSVGDHQEL